MSGLAETLANVKGRRPDPMCPMLRILESMDTEDREALISVMDSEASTRGIQTALATHNIAISRDSITLHREKRCRCVRGENL